MVQFSLRRLFLCVTAVAVVVALARVAPGWVGLAISCGLLSLFSLTIATPMALLDDQRHPILVAGCVLLISVPSFLLGVFFGILGVWACVNVILTVFGG